MQYFLLSGSGRGDLIPYSSAFFATIPRLELMSSPGGGGGSPYETYGDARRKF